MGRNESVTQFTTSELKQLSEERKHVEEEMNRLKDIIAEVKENTSHSIQIEVDTHFQTSFGKPFCNISSFN